ncbi:MAG: hypothetical protein Q7P63_08315 [Verrucomicrobiota bacterium JB022]|nr:hypothetical protein [Verrucomicrobiota bacterium JB022]
MKLYPLFALAASASALSTAGLQAAILASYDFTGIGNAQLGSSYSTVVPGTNPSSIGADVRASQLLMAPYDTALPSYGLTFSGAGGAAVGVATAPVITDNLAGNGIGSREIDTGTRHDAKVANDFLQFVLVPTTGKALHFDETNVLGFDAQIRYGGAAEQAIETTFTVALYTSLDGYAKPVGRTSLTHSGTGGTKSGFVHLSIDLTKIGPVAPDTPVTFRLYLYSDGQTMKGATTLSNRNVDLDNIVVNGSVVSAD